MKVVLIAMEGIFSRMVSNNFFVPSRVIPRRIDFNTLSEAC